LHFKIFLQESTYGGFLQLWRFLRPDTVPPHRKRRSCSPSRHSYDRDSPSNSHKHRRSKDNDKLESILKSLETLKNDVSNCSAVWLFMSPTSNNRKRFSNQIMRSTATPFPCWFLKTPRSTLSMEMTLFSHQPRQNCR